MPHADTPIWQPSAQRIAGSHLTAFTRLAETAYGHSLSDYAALWQASVEDTARFWSLVWDYTGVVGEKGSPASSGSARPRTARPAASR